MPRVVVTAEVENLEKWKKASEHTVTSFDRWGFRGWSSPPGPGNRIAVSGEGIPTNLDAYMSVYRFTSDCGGDGV